MAQGVDGGGAVVAVAVAVAVLAVAIAVLIGVTVGDWLDLQSAAALVWLLREYGIGYV